MSVIPKRNEERKKEEIILARMWRNWNPHTLLVGIKNRFWGKPSGSYSTS